MVVVYPGLGLEVGFGGTLRVRVINGAGNGLDQSSGDARMLLGELRCKAPAGCSAATIAGEVKVQGYEAVQLIQEK